ncbi:Urocanate hydratase [Portunus trituberculatus]|uniref:Urocanate hydratase n=1 Tax=Portunus trituberculatus TaxID=210409 RepID=A0A5B7DKG3_PORTR|nr:Urocanate hydratase [Portunus trituberculatus]
MIHLVFRLRVLLAGGGDRAYPIHEYPARTSKAAAVMHMIMNNLDPRVAQFPQELVTYGGNGSVFSNWAQKTSSHFHLHIHQESTLITTRYEVMTSVVFAFPPQFWLVMHYLSIMTEEQTLVMYSGHPMGLFPSDPRSPRVIVTNGMVIPNYSTKANYDEMFALGVTIYGQMTAGSYCYIGPQGIVHGTTIPYTQLLFSFVETHLQGQEVVRLHVLRFRVGTQANNGRNSHYCLSPTLGMILGLLMGEAPHTCWNEASEANPLLLSLFTQC